MNNKISLKKHALTIISIVVVYFMTMSCTQKKNSSLDLHKLINIQPFSSANIEILQNLDKQIENKNNNENLFDLYTERGFYNLACSEMSKALSDFKFVLEKDGNNIGPISGMIEYYTKVNQYSIDSNWSVGYDTLIVDSIKYYVNKRFSILQDDISYYYRVRIQSDFESKLNDINIAIKINPDFYLAYETKSIIYQMYGKDELALKVLDTLLLIVKDNQYKINILFEKLGINDRIKKYGDELQDIYNISQLLDSPEFTQLYSEIIKDQELTDSVKVKKLETKLYEIDK